MVTQRRRPTLVALALLTALSLVGCADEPPAFAWEGVYTITGWTVDTQGCSLQAPSIHDQMAETHLVASAPLDERGEPSAIFAGACTNPASCRQVAQAGSLEAALGGLTPFAPGELAGESYRSRTSVPVFEAERGVCVATVEVDLLSSPVDGELALEHRTWRDVEFAPRTDAAGAPTCFGQEQALEAAIEETPCSARTVITAANRQPLNPTP